MNLCKIVIPLYYTLNFPLHDFGDFIFSLNIMKYNWDDIWLDKNLPNNRHLFSSEIIYCKLRFI